jgi:carboxymethylenebutenolidase
VYYTTIDSEQSALISCPVLGHFAEVDEFEPDSAQERFIADLQSQGTVVEQRTYPGTEHSFANADVSAFVPDASQQAWSETVEFLRRRLTQGTSQNS